MTISNKTNLNQHPDLYIDGHVIERVEHHKHLGVILSYNLRWSSQINELVVKSRTKLGLMHGLKFKLDRRSLETIYTSFIRPCLEYADVLWAGAYDSDLMKLDMVHIDAMRIVTGATERSNINNLYEETGWMSLQERRTGHVLSLMYKIVNNLAPSYLSNLMPNMEQERNYGLRNNNMLRAPFTRTESYRRSFIPYAITMWNGLPAEIQNITTLPCFKNAIKPQKDSKELYNHGDRWPSIQHARMRIGCSKLNAHLCFNLHVIPSPMCQCGYENEDPMHFYLQCPMYTAQRNKMFRNILPLTPPTLDTLLYGNPNISIEDNKKVFSAIHEFIIETNRFSN